MNVFPGSMLEYHKKLEAAMIAEALKARKIIVPSRINAVLDKEQASVMGRLKGFARRVA